MIGFRKSVPNRRRTGSSTNKLPSSSQQRFPTDPPNLALTFLPLAKNFLGYGRYAKVYRAHYTLRETSGDGAGNGFQTPKGSTMHIPVPPSSSLMSPLNSDGNSLNFSRILVSPHGEDKAITSFEDSVDDDVRPCAVKQMHATRECTEIALTEARVLRMLSGHPNIVRLIGLMSEDDSPSKMSKRPSRISVGGEETEIDFDSSFDDDDTSDFDNFVDDGDDEFEEGCSRMLIVLELADFGTMMDYISNAAGEGIGQQLWMDWAKQLASAVDYVHSLGFVHHDIKPHNCLLVSLSFVELQLNDGKTETLSVKLADFGNALPVQGFQPPPGTAPVSPMSPSVLPESQPHASLLESREMTMSPTPPSPLQLAVRDSSTSSRMHSVDFAGPMANTSTPFGSIGNATTPVSFVERFKSEMSDASIRSSRTGSLTDGLGRGTQAYMAPEIFMATPSKSAGEYSFPVDIYATGCTLFVAATGIAPFSGGVGGSVYVMMGIKRGFWASGMQIGFGPLGPDVSPQPNMAGPRGRDMRRSLCCDDSLPSTGIRANRWLQDGDTVPGGEGVVKFGNGDALDVEAVRIMCACLEAAAVRPTARELVVWLNTLF
ncbi:hypothetical protein HDU83_009694 [Entophlyctis luteolus]|nr:hypothetical protein HDU83_009694 [Entophlyctis luteolus]